MKKIITFTLALILTLSVMTPAMATEAYVPQYTESADTLYALGLFKGKGTDADGKPIYALDIVANRLEGVVMLIRLLGEEDEALAFEGTHPFSDVPDWGAKYIAYAYDKGYTNGISAAKFGSNNELLGKAYVTFVMRALGYSDKDGLDFTYEDALTKAAELGIIEEGQCEGSLYRDDCANVSLIALGTPLKDSETKLAEKLIEDGTLTAEAVEEAGILQDNVENVKYVEIPFANKRVKFPALYNAFPNAAYVYCAFDAGYITEEGAVHDFSELNVFLNAPPVKAYCAGEADSIKVEPETYSGQLKVYDPYYYGFVYILDENAHLIGYAIVPPGHEGNTVKFTVCDFYDGEAAENCRQRIQQILATEITTHGVLYIDEVVTTWAGGVTTDYYLKINDRLANGALKNVAYYSYVNGNTSVGEMFFNMRFSGYVIRDYSTAPEMYRLTADKTSNFPTDYVILYDANYEIIAWARGSAVKYWEG